MKKPESNVEKTVKRTKVMIIDKVKDLMVRKELFAKLDEAQGEYLAFEDGAEALFFGRLAKITEEIAGHLSPTK
jgi:hypothetical protein